MTLLQHGGFVSLCVAGDVSVARFGTESSPSAPGSLRHQCIPDLGSDVGHSGDFSSGRSARLPGELPEACPEIVNFPCKEPA
jgi:hypothetical protein